MELTEEVQAKMTKFLTTHMNQLINGLMMIENYENFVGKTGIELSSKMADGRIVTLTISHPKGKNENTDNITPIK